LGQWADVHGYKAIITEGWDKVLGWRSPNWVYRPKNAQHTKLLLKNYKLSDDVAFRFGNRAWNEYPLSMGKYAQWLDAEDAPVVNLFMDYETFGEHQWADTGIFDFLQELPNEWLKRPEHTFMTISEAADFYDAKDEVSMPHVVTWADSERDLSAWMGNRMQQEANGYIYALEPQVLASHEIQLIGDWRRLTTSDHAYYMSTKYWNDGDVHAYFSPKPSPFDAFTDYMNALRDVRFRLMKIQEQRK
jgi:alpha-amylase